MLRNKPLLLAIALVCGLLAATGAHAQVLISEDFNGTTTSNPWYFFNGACLTASTATAGTNPGTPPGCTADTYYTEHLVGGYNGAAGRAVTLPDPTGNGALRFTNGCIPSGTGGCGSGGHSQNGAIISAGTYSTTSGLDITFKTLTYRGDSGGDANDGADGMSFFLMDASIATAPELAANPADAIGSWGGSLGYTCSNANTDYHGMIGAYLGLGIDEYGNFLNGTTDTVGENSPYGVTGDNTASGGGYQPNRIGLRGAGNIAYPSLSTSYPSDYPATGLTSAQQQAAVQNTCETGTLWNYSTPASPSNTGTTVMDYPAIANGAQVAYAVISSQIANEYSTGGYGQRNATPITYRLKITQNGLLSLSYSYNGGAWSGVIQNEPITTQNGPLPSSVRFGFAGSTGGSSNIHEIMCFKASPATAGASSTTGNEKESSRVDAGTQVYFGSYDPTDWTGSLAAYGLTTDSTGQVTGIASTANWDASCVLTGLASSSNTCATTGVTGPVAAQAPSSRTMLTWSGSAGIPFEWSNLPTAEQSALNAIDGNGQTRLSFLRGDRTNEIPNGSNLFRARDSVLADILDSSPAWVGPPSQSLYFAYETPTAWKDRLNTGTTMPENSGQSYTSYAAAAQTRQNVVYVGANDGLLHGFAAGSYNSDSTYNSAGNNGTEVLAYVPEEVLLGIHPTITTTSTTTNRRTGVTTTTTNTSINSALDFSNPQYGHNFYVDAPPGTGDLYYGGAWHTWVVGGLGAGLSGPWTSQGSCGGTSMPTCASAWSSTTTYSFGTTVSVSGVNYVANWSSLNESPSSDVAVGQGEIYALDVTTPSGFAESGASALVKGDWIGGTSATSNPGSFTCTNVTNCALNLGFTYGTPQIRRLHDGNWAIIFGNGVGSSTGDAGIFILTINPTSNAQTMYYLSTGVSSGNGIAYVSAVDMDHDHVVDYVYAGDLKGNVWRFDLTSASESSWAVSTGPLFKTQSGQPITSQIVPQFVTVNGAVQMMLYFGTGQKFPQTNTSITSYSTGTQSFYAVWDWNMSGWNALHSSQFASLTTTQVGTITSLSSPYRLGISNLASRTMTVDTSGNRTASTSAVVCWANSSTCTSGNTQFGWYMNFPGTSTCYGTKTYEQLVFNPLILSTVVIFNSVLPAIDSPLQCTTGLDNGWSYALDVTTGSVISGFWQGYSSTLPTNTAGYESNATGTMYYAGGSAIYQDTGGQHHHVPIPLPPDITGGRETWVQIR